MTQAEFQNAILTLVATFTNTPLVPPAELAPAPTVLPPVTFTFVQNQRVDSVVPEGTPNTVKCPVTGHILSLPITDIAPDGTWTGKGGEGFMSYLGRVCLQAGCSDAALGIAQEGGDAYQASGLHTAGKTVQSWPLMADESFNRAQYAGVTPAEAAATAAAWDAIFARMKG